MSEDRRIGSFAKVRRGASPRPIGDPKYFGGNVGWVRIVDVTQHNYKYLKTTEQYLSELGQSKSVAVDKGDLIMSICATVGKPIIVDMPACIHDGFVQIYDLIDVDTEYLFYQLQFHEKDFEKRGQPGTQVNLNTKIVEDEEVWLPKNIDIQKKIAKILSDVDRAIAHTEALIEKYQQIKAGLMHDLFTRGIGADGKLRPLRDEAPELYQESAIGWIPISWGVEALDCVKESLVDGPFGSNLKTEHYVSDPGVRVVRLQNIQSTKYNDLDKAFISNKHASFLVRNKVLGNDILVAGLGEERYPVGRSCLYPEDLPPAINKADCFRLRCLKGEMNNGFVMYFLNTEVAKEQIRKYEQGVTRPRINLGNIKRIFVPKPSFDEQLAIFERLKIVEQRIGVEISSKEKFELQKSGLMQDLLTGKVPVNVDANEVDHVSN